MATLYLVRHGRAAASWEADHDPGLDAHGREQARSAADVLARRGPLPLVVSPMARTRETAAALAKAWSVEPRVEPRVSEIPAPTEALAERGDWLRDIAARRWPELDDALQRWRGEVLDALRELSEDSVVVTHFIAINAAVGAASEDDRVVSFHPEHCSVTVLRSGEGGLTLVQRGAEGETRVL